LLAKNVNDNACILNKGGGDGFFASKLAPTKNLAERNHRLRLNLDQPLRQRQPTDDNPRRRRRVVREALAQSLGNRLLLLSGRFDNIQAQHDYMRQITAHRGQHLFDIVQRRGRLFGNP